jgi:ABC-type transport system involved in cytochrome c biogenesis ATPase subunit
MQHPFTGRASELEHIDNLIKDKQGALFAVTGNAGIGKSTLLTQIATIHKDKGQVFIDINDVPPIQTAVEFLQYFAKHAQGLKHTKTALTKINGTYKTTTDLIAPYQSLLQDTVKLGFDEQSEELELTADETGKLTTLVKSSLQLFSIWSKSSQEKAKATLGEPELVLLKALQQDCKNQPLIFIDTYERLQAAQTLSQQKISSLYSKPHERLTPVEAKLSL